MDEEVERGIVQAIPALRRYALALTGSWDSADDLTQDSLERAMRKSHQWRRHGGIKAWLFRIMYRQFLNRRRLFRPSAVEAEPDELAAAPNLANCQERHMACDDVFTALMALPRRQRAAMYLVSVEGYTYDEAAMLMDVPIGTVRSRLARARDAMRAALPEQDRTARLRRVK